MSDLTAEIPYNTNELLYEFREACQSYNTPGASAMTKDRAMLTAIGKAAELDRVLTAGGHLPEEWRNARR